MLCDKLEAAPHHKSKSIPYGSRLNSPSHHEGYPHKVKMFFVVCGAALIRQACGVVDRIGVGAGLLRGAHIDIVLDIVGIGLEAIGRGELGASEFGDRDKGWLIIEIEVIAKAASCTCLEPVSSTCACCAGVVGMPADSVGPAGHYAIWCASECKAGAICGDGDERVARVVGRGDTTAWREDAEVGLIDVLNADGQIIYPEVPGGLCGVTSEICSCNTDGVLTSR